MPSEQVTLAFRAAGVIDNTDDLEWFTNRELLPLLRQWLAIHNGSNGGIKTVTASETITGEHSMFLVDATAGLVTLTLPLALDHKRSYTAVITEGSGNGFSFVRSGADLINGATSAGKTGIYHRATVTPDGGTAYYVTNES